MKALVVICVRTSPSFSEVLKITGLSKSTLWKCVESLKREGLVRSKRVLTVLGPRTLLECTESGRRLLSELKEALQSL